MENYNILLAGFGGQGILFSGKVMANAGLVEGKEVSWLPSYGPEMRGGTANCSVCLSERAIGSPLVTTPDILVVMNQPSYEKYIDAVVPGGKVFIDSTLIQANCGRTDIDIYEVPATQMAKQQNMTGLANIILIGKVLKETGFAKEESVETAIRKCVSARKAHLVDVNMQAIQLGLDLK